MTTRTKGVLCSEELTPPANLSAYFRKHRLPDQDFVIDPTQENLLRGPQGTQLKLSPLSFQDRLGWAVRRPVTVSLTEIFSPARMILTGLGNTSEDRLLEAAGQFHLSASTVDQSVQLALPIAVSLPIASSLQSPLSTQLFSGGISQTSSVQSPDRFDWQPTARQPISMQLLANKKQLQFTITDLKWWNCSAYVQTPGPGTMVSVRWTAPASTPTEVAAFLVFRDRPAVLRMYNSHHGCSCWNVPLGWTARVIVLGLTAGKMLLGCSPWANTSNRPLRVRLEAFDPSEIQQLIPQLCEA